MSALHEAARAALNYLDCPRGHLWPVGTTHDIIAGLRGALAAAEAQPTPSVEPVAWACLAPNGQIAYFDGKPMVMPGPVGNVCHTVPLYAAPPAQPAPAGWTPTALCLPRSGVVVLACYKNSHGNWRRIRAEWVADKSREASAEYSEIGVYDEATDTYYDPEGWYERIDNWDDYSAVAVTQGEITHWMPLPAAPGEAAPTAAPAQVPQPLSDDEVLKLWRESDFRGSGGQADWFAEGIRAAERTHGITGDKP